MAADVQSITVGIILFLMLVTETDYNIPSPVNLVQSGFLKGATDAVWTDGVLSPRQITKFLGIPYAAPPVGSLRFKSPLPAPHWHGVRDATEYGDMCVQDLCASAFTQTYRDNLYKHLRTSEDCLNLNILSPVRPGSSRTLLPVMVWIHGGVFKFGSGMRTDASQLVLHGNVIVVSFNYRVNVFGFMSINGSSATSNNGLRDQIMALQWVKDNIGVFGGDPNKVTIFGNSAGSVSATLLLVSPLARGLFKRAILQSGTVNYRPLYNVEEGYRASNIMASEAGCHQNTGEDVLACLRSLTPTTLFKAWSNSPFTNNPTVPHYGDDVLPRDPNLLFVEGQVGDIDVLLGGNKHDAVGFVPRSVRDNPATMDKTMFETELRKILSQYYPRLNTDKVLAAVQLFYGDTSLNKSYALPFLQILTDRIIYDIEKTADYLVDSNRRVYLYIFTNTPSVRILSWPRWVTGGHAEELQYVFGYQVNPNGGVMARNEEKTLSRQMMTAWTNFAYSGNPNSDDGSRSPQFVWHKYSKDKRQYLEFNIHMAENRSLEDYRGEMTSFWRELIP